LEFINIYRSIYVEFLLFKNVEKIKTVRTLRNITRIKKRRTFYI